ncbi:hypothetical protein [uncultured Pseudoteredinibacter sp.]|uniref:hypothetical protein n=1 Tax=uncultured Pseudoteredinibacter sp. TaxID=1641701 RepID=UPI00260EDBCC|nr:hypothetical protein [uncultured Pseudoteredinibacter sp.]
MKKEVDVYPDLEPEEDKIYRLAEAVTSLIPAGQVMLHSLISPPVQRRMESWIASVEDRLADLASTGDIDLALIKNKEEFSALVLRSIQTASVTSQQEKLNYLENFIVNVARVPEVSEDELYVLLSILNEFTPSHIRVLHFYAHPEEYASKIVNVPSDAPPNNQAQGRELAIVFGQGDAEYWQSVFWLVSGHHVVTNHTSPVKAAMPVEKTVSGRATRLGLKLLNMVVE